MSDDFKKEPSECGKVSLGGSCYMLDMSSAYPFGQLRQLQGAGTEVLVRKKLFVCSKDQQAVLLRTAEVLQQLNHPFLINLRGFEQQGNAVYFYYQYAPLTIEKWILDLGDAVVDGLKHQMLALAAFLNCRGISFAFSPQQLGLSQQIDLQYFLHEFSLLEGAQEAQLAANLAANQQCIGQFFEGFRQEHRKSKTTGVFSSQFVDSDCRKESLQSSITTRESWSPSSPKAQQPARPAKNKLSEQLERAKGKTNEILERLRTMKNLHF